MIHIELSRVLKEKHWTQKKLAEKSGVRPERISRICKGFIDRIEVDHIDRICTALQVLPTDWIVYQGEWMDGLSK